MEGYMPYIWLALAVVLGIVEVSTSQLVSIWFVIAAVLTSVCSATFLFDSFFWQVVVFIVFSAICLMVTRPIIRKIKKGDKARTNSDRYIGRIATVTVDIDWKSSTGQVDVDGAHWSAKSADNSFIKAGTTVLVEEIQGVRLVVTPIDSN